MKFQKGESLVSLLIGLLISMIVIIGLLMVFRSTLRVTVPATVDAISDGERISALLRSHMLLQGAGFGIESPQNGTHLLVSNNLLWTNSGGGGSLGAGSGGSAILWATDIDEDGVLQCEGIVPTNEGGLKYISAVCTNASQWANVQSWTATDVTGVTNFTATVDQVNPCQPFGLAVTGELSIILSASTSGGTPFTSTTCLANFQVTP